MAGRFITPRRRFRIIALAHQSSRVSLLANLGGGEAKQLYLARIIDRVYRYSHVGVGEDRAIIARAHRSSRVLLFANWGGREAGQA